MIGCIVLDELGKTHVVEDGDEQSPGPFLAVQGCLERSQMWTARVIAGWIAASLQPHAQMTTVRVYVNPQPLLLQARMQRRNEEAQRHVSEAQRARADAEQLRTQCQQASARAHLDATVQQAFHGGPGGAQGTGDATRIRTGGKGGGVRDRERAAGIGGIHEDGDGAS